MEFALIAPVLALIVFGIVEFGWAFSQNLDVRHGAREAARLAVVDFTPSVSVTTAADRRAAIIAEACSRMEASSGTTIDLRSDSGTAGLGEVITVEVRRPLQQLTGFLTFALDGVILTSTVEMRMEQDAEWAVTGGAVACP